MTPRLSIVMVTWNTRELTLASLASVHASAPTVPFEIILVDNASTDDTMAAVSDRFPDVRQVVNDRNLGFGRGANAGAAQARGDKLLFLNSDTVVGPGAIDALVAFSVERPEAGLWGGRTVFADQRVNPNSSAALPTLWSHICFALGLNALFAGTRLFNPEHYAPRSLRSPREVATLSACFLLVSKALFEKINGFDPSIFMYGEDVDFCIRARAFGATPHYTPKATIIHHDGRSSNPAAIRIYLLAAKIELARRHQSTRVYKLSAICIFAGAAVRYSVYGLGARLNSRWGRSAAIWTTVWRNRQMWRNGTLAQEIGDDS